MSDFQRKFSPMGDLQVKENYDKETKEFSEAFIELDGEKVQAYQIHVYIPNDVDEAGIGEPSIILKKDQYINARALTSSEEGKLPDFLKGKVPCKLSVALDRKQYPRKQK